LIQNKDMLLKYFAIRIDDETGSLTGLPILLDGHAPGPARLPLFLLRLATCVDYQQELACFDGVCRELGIYYGSVSSSSAKELFPAIRSLLQPPHEIELQPMTSLKECYKVFERC
jgi:DNA mismatch repair protein MLH1